MAHNFRQRSQVLGQLNKLQDDLEYTRESLERALEWLHTYGTHQSDNCKHKLNCDCGLSDLLGI
jgi:hypothetical protein